MAEATVQLVKRLVVGPKPIHAFDAKGRRCVYNVGEEVMLTQQAANRFERYLSTPEIAQAQAKVEEARKQAAALKQATHAKEQADIAASKKASVASSGGAPKGA